MNTKKNDCLVCGQEIIYLPSTRNMVCEYCEKTFASDVKCKADHFICDSCHQTDPNDFIEKFCCQTTLNNPWEISNKIMGNQTVKMHGPEHHFLVPAALLAAYYNILEKPGEKKRKINMARQRAEKVPGGYCGSHGTCGAAIGSGIFISLILEATPLSENEWHLSNLMTSKSLYTVSMNGGPRCCKRDTYLSIKEAVTFVKQKFNTEIPLSESLECQFYYLNKECRKLNCNYFPIKSEA